MNDEQQSPNTEQSIDAHNEEPAADAPKRPGRMRKFARFMRRWSLRFAFLLLLVIALFELNRWWTLEQALLELEYEINRVEAQFLRGESPQTIFNREVVSRSVTDKDAHQALLDTIEEMEKRSGYDQPDANESVEFSDEIKRNHALIRNLMQLSSSCKDPLDPDFVQDMHDAFIDAAERTQRDAAKIQSDPASNWPAKTELTTEIAREMLSATEFVAKGIAKCRYADRLTPRVDFEADYTTWQDFITTLRWWTLMDIAQGRIMLHEYLGNFDAWQRETLDLVRLVNVEVMLFDMPIDIFDWRNTCIAIAEEGIQRGYYDYDGLGEITRMQPRSVSAWQKNNIAWLCITQHGMDEAVEDYHFKPLEYVYNPADYFDRHHFPDNSYDELEDFAGKRFWRPFLLNCSSPRMEAFYLSETMRLLDQAERMLADPDWYPKHDYPTDTVIPPFGVEAQWHMPGIYNQLAQRYYLFDTRLNRMRAAASLLVDDLRKSDGVWHDNDAAFESYMNAVSRFEIEKKEADGKIYNHAVLLND